MKSIKKKILVNFLLVIFSIVIILNVTLAIFVTNYYYDNTEAMLKNQVSLASNFYNKYFSSASLIENVYDNVDAFWDQANVQVQIFDAKGQLLMDSIGAVEDSNKVYDDVHQALKSNEIVRWVGKVNYSKNKVMALTKALVIDDEVIGAIRFITSLEVVNNDIHYILLFFIAISIFVIIIGIILSYFMSEGIILPIKRLTDIAEKMAYGDFSVRSNYTQQDEIGKLANTLDYMAEEIVNRDQLKNEFISSVSHELRTPLTAIKGWVITLNNEETDKEVLKMGLDIVEKETDRLTKMVEELLDFSKFVNGKIVLKKSKTNIAELIEYIEVYMGPRANRENKEFKVKSNNIREYFYIDVDRIKQVLINLIDNSFKFTEKGGKILVSIYLEDKMLKISVVDNGCGISKEDIPRIKEKFYKGKNVNSSNGIGLSICDEIIKLHGGEFIIESELDKGTTIKITIPIDTEVV